MRLFVLTIGDDTLRAMPEDERILFVQLSHITNDIAILHKLLLFTHKTSDSEIIRDSIVAQGSLAARLLAGVLYEAWQVLQSTFFNSTLAKTYEDLLPNEPSGALRELKAYFRGGNTISTVRNHFAFHYDRGAVQDYLDCMDEKSAELYHIYLSDDHGNSLYYLAEEISGMAMVKALGSVSPGLTPGEAHQRLYEDLIAVSGHFQTFASGCMILVLDKYCQVEGAVPYTEAIIDDGPPVNEVAIPYFVSRPTRR
jgi:hypothetical protein